MRNLTFLVSLLILISCQQNEEEIYIDPNNPVLGSWSYPIYEDNNTITYERVSGIIADAYTCTLKNNGNFIEHKNAGWCGTPPISYADFTGNWYQENEKIKINSEYWGGTFNLTWEIISVNDKNLQIKITYPE